MGKLFLTFLVLGAGFFIIFIKKIDNVGINSPVPQVFGTETPEAPKNNWFPTKSINQELIYEINIGAKSVLLVDYDSGETLFSKNAHDKLPAASTIKIMTALVALENAGIEDTFTVSLNAAKIGENSMGLTAGEKLTLRELLYGLMLVSGNDAAVTIAEGIAGSEEEFVKTMNTKASVLGISNTRFVNSTGLDEDGKSQYATAHDMLTIAHYVWENYPEFGKITVTDHIYIETTNEHKAFDLYNDTNLLTSYPGVRGIKPGFTWKAGLCLVTYAENDGKRLLAVILGSDDRRGEMKELLDYGFASYGITVDHPGLDL